MKQSIAVLQGKDVLSISLTRNGKSRHFQIRKGYLTSLLVVFFFLVISFLAIFGFNAGLFVNYSLNQYITQNFKKSVAEKEQKISAITVTQDSIPTQDAPFVENFNFVTPPKDLAQTRSDLINITNVRTNRMGERLRVRAYLENITEPHQLLRGRFAALLWNNKILYTAPATINFDRGTFFHWEKLPTFSFNRLRPIELLFSNLPKSISTEDLMLTLLFFDDGKNFTTKVNYDFVPESEETTKNEADSDNSQSPESPEQ